jgi:hypothetical protein
MPFLEAPNPNRHKHMLHADTMPGWSDIDRTGIVASKALAAGTIVWGPCDGCAIWSAREMQSLSQMERLWLDEFGYYLDDGSVLLVCGSGYLFNHSCDPNILSDGLDFGIAVREIRMGAELTIDYRAFRNERDWALTCNCREISGPHTIIANGLPDPDYNNRNRSRLDLGLTLMASRPQPIAQRLALCSRSYQTWLQGGHFTSCEFSICDPRTGRCDPARNDYLRNEMGRVQIRSSRSGQKPCIDH